MSTLRHSLAVAALLVMATLVRPAVGQIVSELENGRHPFIFIEPDTFRPDFQFFAPADATDYEVGDDVDARRGFFFTYDRVYMNVQRPRTTLPVFPSTAPPGDPFAQERFSYVSDTPSQFEGDFTWGNRLEGGFIDADDRGWTMVGWHIDGPNRESVAVAGDRLGGPATDGAGTVNDIDPDGGSGYDFQAIGLPGSINGTTDLPVLQSVNTAKISSYEIMRIFERMELHHGGVIEPIAGVRYIQFRDRWRNISYLRANVDAFPDVTDDLEFYRDEQNGFENNMLGAQAGFRYFKQSGHWTLSTEFRAFGMQNWQHYYSMVDNYIYSADTTEVGRIPNYARQERIMSNASGNDFVWGGEIKTEAAYQLTRDIDFRTSFVFLDLGRGVGRGRDLTYANQGVFMYGLTFGFAINR